jgi:tRNA A-37 threonylcarbamoyl transferase component Bud32
MGFMGTPRLVIRPDNPDFLDLPWEEPIYEWEHPRLVEMPTGIHRHPVVFVAYDEGVFAIKELPRRVAETEYDVLRLLEERTHRAASPAGWVERPWVDRHSEQAAAVITRYVRHSFPYRRLVTGLGFGERRDHMLDSVASLLAELHLAGLYWGDCSLSNLLYRWDAGLIEAIMIDGETSMLKEELSDGQRGEDLAIMIENVAGEMADIAAENEGDIDAADLGLGEDIAKRYEALWAELTEQLVIGRNETFRIRQRIERLQSLGFAVDDFVLEPAEEGRLVRMKVSVGGRTFHADRLSQLTGVEASENQARVILGDLSYFQARTGVATETERVLANMKWLSQSFEPLVQRIAREWPESDPVQRYCDYLHNRLLMAQEQGSDVDNEEAFEHWIADGGPGIPAAAWEITDLPEPA